MKSKKTVIVLIVLVLLCTALILCREALAPKTVEGQKAITVTVVHGDGTSKEFAIHTDSDNLRGAIEQEQLASGPVNEMGMFVETVDGETADSAAEEWWCFTKSGESMSTGVDDTMISDGDAYEIALTVGYDW